MNKVNWALRGHGVAHKGRVSAKALFREQFPTDDKAFFDNALESEGDIQSWIKRVMDLADWNSPGKGGSKVPHGKGKGKTWGKFKGCSGMGKSSSSSAAPSAMPPPPPPNR